MPTRLTRSSAVELDGKFMSVKGILMAKVKRVFTRSTEEIVVLQKLNRRRQAGTWPAGSRRV